MSLMTNIYRTRQLLEGNSFDKYKDYFREYSVQAKAGKIDASLVEYMLAGELLPHNDLDFDQEEFAYAVDSNMGHSEEVVVRLRDNTEITLQVDGSPRGMDQPFEIEVEVTAVVESGRPLELFRTTDQKYWFSQDQEWGRFLGW